MEQYLKEFETYVSHYGVSAIKAILIIIIGMWLSGFITRLIVKAMTKRDVDLTVKQFVGGLVKTALVVLVIITAIDQAGIETTSFLAVLGAAGLAIGLALQGSLSNFASGVMLIIFRPIRVGDYVEAGGAAGTISEIGIFVTVMTTPDNKVIYVPNSKLASDNIINYSIKPTRRVDMVFGISYSDDIDKAKSIINDILAKDERILKDPAPLVVLSELADSSVNFKVAPWVKGSDYWSVYFDTHETVKKRFDEAGVSIPFPQQDVHLFNN